MSIKINSHIQKILHIFIIISLFQTTNSDSYELNQWVDNTKIIDDPTGYDSTNLDSFSLSNITGTKLYLDKKTPNNFLYIKNKLKLKLNDIELNDIISPLVELDNEYYFCSSKNLYHIKDGQIELIEPRENVKNYTNDYSIKCYYHEYLNSGNITKNIYIIFIKSIYGYTYNINSKNWIDEGHLEYTGIKRSDKKEILAVNAINLQTDNPHIEFIVKEENKYIFLVYQIANNFFSPIHNIDLTQKDEQYDYLEFFSETKLSFLQEQKIIIFTYEPNTSKFKFYHVNYGTQNFIIRGGKNYFRFFQDFSIIYMDFFENTPLMYYSIKSLKDSINYIGVADLQYFMVIYNTLSNENEKIFDDYGYFYSSKSFINYFIGNKQMTICPFVYENEKCVFFSENKLFYMKKNENNFYENSFTENCSDKIIIGNYCIETCPVGYYQKDQNCMTCGENEYFNIATKTCSNECSYPKESNICYNCNQTKLKYYNFSCYENCGQIYGKVDSSNEDYCIMCKDENLYFDDYTKTCTEKCENGKINDYNNVCTVCKNYNKYYYKIKNKCVEKCDESKYYISNNETYSCEFCPKGTYFFQGNCVKECEIGYQIATKNIDNTETEICENCFEQNLYYHDKKCYEKCPLDRQFSDKKKICYRCYERENEVGGKYYFEKYNKCVNDCNEDGYENYHNDTEKDFYCRYCKDYNLYYNKNKNNTCQKSCDKYQHFNESDNICYYCYEKNLYEENNTCIENCTEGFGIDKSEKIINLCKYCHDENLYYYNNECLENCPEYRAWDPIDNICKDCSLNKTFFQNYSCVNNCNGEYISNIGNYTCEKCPEDSKYIFGGGCIEKCPNYTIIKNDNKFLCLGCGNYYYLNGECISQCKEPYIVGKTNDGLNFCDLCDEGKIYQNGECVEGCEKNFYKINFTCYSCGCLNNGTCENESNKCNCEDEEHYFGYSCEFYSEKNIFEKNISIYSLSNSSIYSNKTFFGYKFNYSNSTNNFNESSDNYTVIWKFYREGKEFTNFTEYKDYKHYFITGNNDNIFGINEGLFLDGINNNLNLLIINNTNNETIFSDSILIEINKIISLKYGYDVDDTSLKPFHTKFIFSIEDNNENNKNNQKIKYYTQYLYEDFYGEKLPLSNYIENEKITIYPPPLKNFVINLKNDRGEIYSKSTEEISESLDNNTRGIEEILNDNLSNIEKLYEFFDVFYKGSNKLNNSQFLNIFKLINETIELIKDPKNMENENITLKYNINYLEPKTIFALINYIIINQNNQNIELSNENIIETLYVIDSIFINNIDLSDSDSLSLFRTLDNLIKNYKKSNNHTKEINKKLKSFIEKFEIYLSNKTYPGENIRLLGNELSIYNIHFGRSQKILSIPLSIDSSESNSIKNYLLKNDESINYNSYNFENYNINEKICDNYGETLICIDTLEYLDLKNKLENNANKITDFVINFYILNNLQNNNNKYNYSISAKLFNISNNSYINQPETLNISYNISFPFNKSQTFNDTTDYTEIKSYFLNIFDDIFGKKSENQLNNYSNITCVPMNYIKKDSYICKTHFNYKKAKIICSCNILDEISIIDDYRLANYYKHKQFSKIIYTPKHIINISVFYIFILLLLIPNIFYLIYDICKDKTSLKNPEFLVDFSKQRQSKYYQIKKYFNSGILKFSILLTFSNFPFFNAFNSYDYKSPKFIKHFIVITGIFLGCFCSLIPFYFMMPFDIKQDFIDERDIEKDDNAIHSIKIDLTNNKIIRYLVYSIISTFLGMILANLFIYLFNKILMFDMEKNKYWRDVKNVFSNYIYFDIKNDVLLGQTWKKVKMRMKSFYVLCGKYTLKENIRRHKTRNKKFENYLRYINKTNLNNSLLNNTKDGKLNNELNELDQIMPNLNYTRFTELNQTSSIDDNNYNSNFNNIISNNQNNSSQNINKSKDSNNSEKLKESSKNKKLQKKINDVGCIFDNDNETSLISKGDYNNNYYNNAINNSINNISDIKGNKKESMYSDDILSELKIEKIDNFKLINNKNDNLKKIYTFEKIKTKYMCHKKQRDIKEAELDDVQYESEKANFSDLKIIYENNYSYIPFNNFIKIKNKVLEKNRGNINTIFWWSFILFLIFSALLLSSLYLITVLLNEYEYFIIRIWIIPFILFTILNFILYFLKMFICSLLLFKCYHLRKKGCCLRIIFYCFIDKTMINIFKVRNYITKYKREFDYL